MKKKIGIRRVNSPHTKYLLLKFNNAIESIETSRDSHGNLIYMILFCNVQAANQFKDYFKQDEATVIDYQPRLHEPNKKDDYFESYNLTFIHKVMLGDENRNKAYYKAVLHNPKFFKDKIIMDIGAGSGILSLFAARAGAKRVYAIEAVSGMAEVCRQIVHVNGFEDVIKVVESRVEQIEGIGKSVDVIMSEWMGYCMFYEGMLHSVLYARDRFLKERGLLFPNKACLKLFGYSDPSILQKRMCRLSCPNQLYDYSCLKENTLSMALVQTCNNKATKTCTLLSIDLETWNIPKNGLLLDSNWKLLHKNNTESARIDGFVIYFNVSFTHGLNL
ncbi:protein arginine N-methyltransferase 1 [Lepeophtheirus salmonis]|uniref:protein arginine N-methyltransferase 1 n=1 Tax=Lepeophtheirus salmonis TaxID=72036 RepID=UPI001AE2755F|nr:protein arginine N-methyltransferase 1-like [Lepeophtheirus salmonis]